MLSAELASSTALLNASYQRSNGPSKDEVCLSTIYEKGYTTATPGAGAGAGKPKEAVAAAAAAATMTKQLTTSTATNAASSITQAGDLAPTVISPTTVGTIETRTGAGAGSEDAGAGASISDTPKALMQPTITGIVPAAVATAESSRAVATKPSSSDASGRSAALERAYVHDVYEHCEEPTGPIRPRMAHFLSSLEPGSVVCDVGCGSGRYLTQCNPAICTIGVERCYRLSKVAHAKGGEVALCDNLELPFRDDSFDAVLSLAVVHHFATTERRVQALRELARILRIGGRVVITVWALEQRHRRFESQDVLIPWQPPKNRNYSYSDEEDDDNFQPPYHAYTEDSTNSSRSAGDGDSSSLSSSSPGESCYSFVRRAIQKLARGRRHAWFMDSWSSKDTKNDSSLDFEDAKDLPIELRRLEDFEDFPDPPLSAGLKSRSLGSILQPPPRQIVRSRSSVPSLGGPLIPGESKASAAALLLNAPEGQQQLQINGRHSPTSTASAGNTLSRRPKLIKQKQSLCEEDAVSVSEVPEAFQMLSSYNGANGAVSSSLYMRSGCYAGNFHQHASSTSSGPAPGTATSGAAAGSAGPQGNVPGGSGAAPTFLRKQSSLNEELMACNRLREKERVRKRIQKQTSLNEAFLCRSALFSKRLQVIREGFTTKIKSSTGSLERVTKTGISKLIQNIKSVPQAQSQSPLQNTGLNNNSKQQGQMAHLHQHHHHHHHNHPLNHLSHLIHPASGSSSGPVTYCNIAECTMGNLCHCSQYQQECPACAEAGQGDSTRRHSRESGSDSSKDSSLQSDTSIESEDSFASVIFIPKPEQHQQQLNYQQQHQNSNSSSSNSSSSNGQRSGAVAAGANPGVIPGGTRLPPAAHSVPTSPLIMPCPPTPAHSPAAIQGTVTSPPQSTAAVSAAMAILTPPSKPARFSFDEAHIRQQKEQLKEQKDQVKTPHKADAKEQKAAQKQPSPVHRITRQAIRDLPPIPKFRKQQSLQLQRQSFPIIRRASGSGISASCSSSSLASKLLSLELFNPATDDLDSDSSEPSSPDSIDSVISAPRSAKLPSGSGGECGAGSANSNSNSNTNSQDEGEASSLAQLISLQQEQYHKGELQINSSTHTKAPQDDIILNADSAALLPEKRKAASQKQDCAEFAEQLTVQLQRELEDKSSRAECRYLDGIGMSDLSEILGCGGVSKKRSNGDLSAFRDELRERRLMLANLSTQPSLQQSPVSSSTSSLSSQTRSFTIQEEDGEEEEENESSYSLGVYEHCKISKFSYKRNRHYQLNPETAYLLQDDGDSDVREEDEDDAIPEEEEEPDEQAEAEALEARGGDQLGEGMVDYGQRRRHMVALKVQTPVAQQPVQQTQQQPHQEQVLQQRHSSDSLEHSNSSTNSLDSPSQGGASTHHRYYHVFREGELDALINHHVASLHIVSSYYERASWCVVAEKVQVWTI
ncbi:hypothetical protein KR018_000252 [Drosophila ironensis]|nr:hypothetical protein KR018_000252 [Drosophila ironensis]